MTSAGAVCRPTNVMYRHHTRIARIVDGSTIEIERPLPWDLYSNFKPIAIHKFLPSIHNFGFSGFSVITRAGRYAGECGADAGGCVVATWSSSGKLLGVRVYLHVTACDAST